jgi:hypothetical protein
VGQTVKFLARIEDVMIDLLFLSCWWLLFLLSSHVPVYLRTLWYGTLITLLVITGSVVGYCYYRDAYPEAMISDEVTVRVGPHETYGVCGVFKAKDKVVVCDSHDNWKQVQKIYSSHWYYALDTIRGWVPQESVVVVYPKHKNTTDIS